MTRHVLGVLGVIAASVLLAVSAMMNYRFGYSLGKSPADGQIYGMASAAADCFKALVPFFFFAAWRNRMWSQALAAVLVWVVVTGYAMTSALGHAALNRGDTNGQRAAATATYKDLRDDLKLNRDKLSWLPPHRAAAAVKADMEGLKSQYMWNRSSECSEPAGKMQREFCQGFRKLEAEHANAQEAAKLNGKIEEIAAKLSKTTGATVMAEADPQASVLSKMTGVELETVQTALTLFVAVLIEIGSGFGMYVAFAYWRPHAPQAPAPPAPVPQQVAVRQDAVWSDGTPPANSAATESGARSSPAVEHPVVHPRGHNDNESSLERPIMPPNDVQLFYKEAVLLSEPSSGPICSQELYDGYKLWAGHKEKLPVGHSSFSKEFAKLGYKTVRIGGRQRYPGLSLSAELQSELDERTPARRRKTPLEQDVPPDQSKAA